MKFVVTLLAMMMFVSQPTSSSSGLASPLDPRDGSTNPETLRVEAKQIVGYWEQRLAGALRLQKEGLVSEGDVDKVRFELASSRHALGWMSNDHQQMRAQLAQIVKIRDAELKRIEKQSPKATRSIYETERAQRRLANAKAHLAWEDGRFGDACEDLQQIIRLSKADLQRLSEIKKGAVVAEVYLECARRYFTGVEVDLECARRRLAVAEYHLSLAETHHIRQITRQIAQVIPAQALHQGRSPFGIVVDLSIPFGLLDREAVALPQECVVEQLRNIVELNKEYLQREMQLQQKNALGQKAIDFSKLCLLWNQERLARAEQKPKEVVQLLENFVLAMEPWATREGLLPDEAMQRKLTLISARYELALAIEGVDIDQFRFGPLAELDY